MHSRVFALATVDAEQLDLGTRQPPRGVRVHDDSFWDGYDSSTLIYDCFWHAGRSTVRIICPNLVNFEPPLLAASFDIDGLAVVPKLRRFARFTIIDLPAKAQPHHLQITLGSRAVVVRVNRGDTARYHGSNVLYTMLKDEPVSWVRDWIIAHQRNHRADAVLIANNGSRSTTSEELRQAISDIPGITVADVLDVPRPYAPRIGTTSKIGRCSFLQTACLNLVRDRFLMQARAVLQCDIDELVAGPQGQSIFDATARAVLKFKRIPGEWRYYDPSDGTPRHRGHTRTATPADSCASKYCIVPDSVVGRMAWDVHGPAGVNRQLLPKAQQYKFLHCRGITTSWKNARQQPDPALLTTDPETEAFMARSFPSDC